MSAMDLLSGPVDTESKPYFGFSRLAIGYHEIIKFRFVMNKMYRADAEKPGLKRTILVELADQVLFLPEYFARKFEDDDDKITELNSDGIKKYMFFGGKRQNR